MYFNRKSRIQKRPRGLKWLALGAMLFALSFPAQAQQVGKIYRIGWLGPTGSGKTESMVYVQPFLEQLGKLGWVEGKQFVMEYRSPQAKSKWLPTLAADLVRLNVDVIVTITSGAAVAAKKATTTIPVVMGGASRPVKRGLIVSLARPGGNVTGLALPSGPKFSSKRLQLFKEAVPGISRVADLRGYRSRTKGKKEKAFRRRVYDSLGLTQINVEVQGADFAGAFARIIQTQADALFVSPQQIMFKHSKRIVNFANTNRLPALFGAREFVEVGGLMSYYTDWIDLKRQAAVYVDKILKGSNPTDLPVEWPRKFDLVINLKTAKQIGVTISPEVLYRADKVIK